MSLVLLEYAFVPLTPPLHPKCTHPRRTMSSHSNIAKVGVAAAQIKPATQKYGAFQVCFLFSFCCIQTPPPPILPTTTPILTHSQGPAYAEATRSSTAGLYAPAAGNERPFVNAKDEFKSTTGMFTWDPESPQTRSASHGGLWKHTLYGNEKIRAAKTLHTTQHNHLHFLGNYPGRSPSNTFAQLGQRVWRRCLEPHPCLQRTHTHRC